MKNKVLERFLINWAVAVKSHILYKKSKRDSSFAQGISFGELVALRGMVYGIPAPVLKAAFKRWGRV